MKYELELDEAEARAIVYDLRNDGSDMEKAIADQIEGQIPLPAPRKVGAVVRTTGADHDKLTTKFVQWSWAEPRWMTPQDEGGNAYDTERIGRIVEILAEGVDL